MNEKKLRTGMEVLVKTDGTIKKGIVVMPGIRTARIVVNDVADDYIAEEIEEAIPCR